MLPIGPLRDRDAEAISQLGRDVIVHALSQRLTNRDRLFKIVGFEVRPVTESSSMVRARVPRGC
jgi:hypothetical protein